MTKSSLKNSQYYDKIKYFITNFDILSVFPNCKIIKYADLDEYENIYELMPNTIDFVFLLTESEENAGHWTLLLRSDEIFHISIVTENLLKIYYLLFHQK